LYGTIAMVFLLIFAWLFTGKISKNYLEEWLKAHGAIDVTIRSIMFNPFTLSVSVQDVDIRKKNGSFIHLENAFIDFSLQGLFQREIQISEAVIREVNLSVKREGQQVSVKGFFLPLVEARRSLEEYFSSRMWAFRLTQASVLNSNIHLQLPELNRKIQIDNCLIWDVLVSGKKSQGSFSFAGDVNGAEMKIESTFGVEEKAGSAYSKISLKKIALSDFRGLLPDSVSQLQGDFSFDSIMDVDMENDRIEISQKGKGEIVYFKVMMSPYAAENAAINFQEDFLITLRQGKISSSRIVATLNSQDFQLTDTDTDFTIVKWKNARINQLDADIRLEINKNKISGKTLLGFHAICPEFYSLGRTVELTNLDTLPIDVATGYLLDQEGNLELDVPISGSLDDPDFKLPGFFQSVVMKAVRSSAYHKIQTRILPYRALIHDGTNAAIYDEGLLTGLRLDPVVLDAGEVLPGMEADEYSRQLSELMKQETGLRIIICGFSTNGDRNILKSRIRNSLELDRMLLDIAIERTETFREILISHYGVPSSRILNCQPRFDTDEDAKPRIEIRL